MVLNAVIKLFKGPFLHLECLQYLFHEISVVVCYNKLEHDWTCSCYKTSPQALRYNAE